MKTLTSMLNLVLIFTRDVAVDNSKKAEMYMFITARVARPGPRPSLMDSDPTSRHPLCEPPT